MVIMSLDYSMRKTGFAVCKVEGDSVTILESGIIHSDSKLDIIPRITQMLSDIWEVYDKYKPKVYIREAAFVGRASTAKGVLYAHAILELECHNRNIEIEDVHNSTLKAYCKKYLTEKAFYTKEELKQFDKKQVVAEFLKAYFSSDMPEIYTARGRLKDDEADAICLSIYYKEKML